MNSNEDRLFIQNPESASLVGTSFLPDSSVSPNHPSLSIVRFHELSIHPRDFSGIGPTDTGSRHSGLGQNSPYLGGMSDALRKNGANDTQLQHPPGCADCVPPPGGSYFERAKARRRLLRHRAELKARNEINKKERFYLTPSPGKSNFDLKKPVA
ncbi:hypothetical protein AAMO2058_000232600 [Amorphochlora amoebiformis]